MKLSTKLVAIYGVAIWAILILASLVLRVYETGASALFESAKFLILAIAAVAFSVLYVKKVKNIDAKTGFTVGLLWALVVIALDLVLYAMGLFNLSLGDYFKDVASTYLVLPITAAIIMGNLKSK